MQTEFIPFSALLRDVVDNRGKSCPTAPTGIPLIATNCIRNDCLYPTYEKVRYVSQETYDTWFRGHPNSGDLIFVNKGTPGRVAMVPDPVDFCIAQDMVALRVEEKRVYPSYLFALLRSRSVQVQIEQMHVGTLIPHFKKGDFDKLLLPVPIDREAQVFIGDFYFELSKKIDLHRRMNETLDTMGREIFKSWFAEPARRRTPPGWRTCSLGDVIDVKHGYAFEGDFFRDEPRPDILLTPGNFAIGGGFKGDKFKYYEGPVPSEFILSEGDLLITMTDLSKGGDTLGYGALVPPPPDGHRFLHNQRLGKVVIPDSSIIGKAFLFQILRTPNYRAEILGGATGTTVKHTSPNRIKAFKITLPPPAQIRKYEDLLAPWLRQTALNLCESRTLAVLRDTLLPKLISGQVAINSSRSSLHE